MKKRSLFQLLQQENERFKLNIDNNEYNNENINIRSNQSDNDVITNKRLYSDLNNNNIYQLDDKFTSLLVNDLIPKNKIDVETNINIKPIITSLMKYSNNQLVDETNLQSNLNNLSYLSNSYCYPSIEIIKHIEKYIYSNNYKLYHKLIIFNNYMSDDNDSHSIVYNIKYNWQSSVLSLLNDLINGCINEFYIINENPYSNESIVSNGMKAMFYQYQSHDIRCYKCIIDNVNKSFYQRLLDLSIPLKVISLYNIQSQYVNKQQYSTTGLTEEQSEGKTIIISNMLSLKLVVDLYIECLFSVNKKLSKDIPFLISYNDFINANRYKPIVNIINTSNNIYKVEILGFFNLKLVDRLARVISLLTTTNYETISFNDLQLDIHRQNKFINNKTDNKIFNINNKQLNTPFEVITSTADRFDNIISDTNTIEVDDNDNNKHHTTIKLFTYHNKYKMFSFINCIDNYKNDIIESNHWISDITILTNSSNKQICKINLHNRIKVNQI